MRLYIKQNTALSPLPRAPSPPHGPHNHIFNTGPNVVCTLKPYCARNAPSPTHTPTNCRSLYALPVHLEATGSCWAPPFRAPRHRYGFTTSNTLCAPCATLVMHRVVQRLLLCRRGARGGSSSSATAASPPAVRVGRPLALLARRCAAIAAGHTRTLLHTTACTQPCVGWNIHSPKLEQSTTRRWAIVSNGCSTTPMRETSGRLITWWPWPRVAASPTYRTSRRSAYRATPRKRSAPR